VAMMRLSFVMVRDGLPRVERTYKGSEEDAECQRNSYEEQLEEARVFNAIVATRGRRVYRSDGGGFLVH